MDKKELKRISKILGNDEKKAARMMRFLLEGGDHQDIAQTFKLHQDDVTRILVKLEEVGFLELDLEWRFDTEEKDSKP